MPTQQHNPPPSPADLTGLRCPKCDYDLTGLTKTKCPECGENFDPDILRQPKPSRALNYTAHAICAYSAFTLIFQVVLLILPEPAFLLGSFDITDFVVLGLNMSVWGGLVIGITAIAVITISAYESNGSAMSVGMLALMLSLVSAALALLTIPYLM